MFEVKDKLKSCPALCFQPGMKEQIHNDSRDQQRRHRAAIKVDTDGEMKQSGRINFPVCDSSLYVFLLSAIVCVCVYFFNFVDCLIVWSRLRHDSVHRYSCSPDNDPCLLTLSSI